MESQAAPECPVCSTASMPIHLVSDGDGGWVCVAGCYYHITKKEINRLKQQEIENAKR